MDSASRASTNSSTAPISQEMQQQRQQPQHQLPPKDNSTRTPQGAPPPYTPPARQLQTSPHPLMVVASHSLPLSGLQQTYLRQQQQPVINTTQRTLTTHVLNDTADEAYCGEEDTEASLFPLTMRINTAISVSKNDNIVCLSDTPTQHASTIAAAVSKAIEQSSSGSCGIPMVDGDGNPRPIRIEVDAGTVVDGQRNVVGTEAAVLNILRQREVMRQQQGSRERRERVSDEGWGNEGGASESLGEPSSKKRRST